MAMTHIDLANDTWFESQPNGEVQTYWSDASTWGMCEGASALRVTVTVSAVSTNSSGSSITAINLLMQWSVDGHGWVDFMAGASPNPSLAAVNPDTGPTAPHTYAPHPYEMAPYVRFGIQMKSTVTGQQVRGRASVDIAVLSRPESYNLEIVHEHLTGSTETLGGVFSSAAFNRATMYVENDGTWTGGAGDPVVTFETSYMPTEDSERGHWRPVSGMSVTITAASQKLSAVSTGELDLFMRCRVAPAGRGTKVTVNLVLRPDAAM